MGNLGATPKAANPMPQVNDNVKPNLIEIFRAGKHTDVNGNVAEFTQADIAAIAASYSAANSEAPLVVGHPQLNGPAYGWVKNLTAQGDVLLAEPHQVETSFGEMVNAGRFKKRSASFFLPDSPGNPTPGKHYLRHVGFLGAAAPAVKGLRDCSFADDSSFVEFSDENNFWNWRMVASVFRNLRDHLIGTDGIEVADRIIPDYQIENIQDAARPSREAATLPAYAAPGIANTNEATMKDQTTDFAERETQLAAEKATLDARAAALTERENAARRTNATDFADGLVTNGKLLPAQKAGVIELFMALPADKTISFAEGDGTKEVAAEEILRQVLIGMPQQISFAEKSGRVSDIQNLQFAAPAGTSIDGDRAELHNKAKAYQASNPGTTWIGAVAAVGG